jgi:nitroreductase
MEEVMSKAKKKVTSKPEPGMGAMDAIYKRRAVRDYTSQKIDKATIQTLLDAAVHAPTAVHEEPWAFAVIQDKGILKRLSDTAKSLLASGADSIHPLQAGHASDRFTNPEFNAFYNAGTLIIICGKPLGPFVAADCWLAAENLMLAACANGLGTCAIGLSVTALNTPQWKKELGISVEMTAFAPIVVGIPGCETPAVPRKQPEILSWK